MNQNLDNHSPLQEIDLNPSIHLAENSSLVQNVNHCSFDLNCNTTNNNSSGDHEDGDDGSSSEHVNIENEHPNGFNDGLDFIMDNSKPNLHNDLRKQIFEELLARSAHMKLPIGVTKEVAASFAVNVRTVQRIWSRGKDCMMRNETVDVCSRKPKNCGRKRVVVLDPNFISDIPLSKRTTVRDLAAAANVGKHTIERFLKSGEIRRHTNCIKPMLTEQNKKARLQWCLSMLDPSSVPLDPIFKGMFDTVFIDEKWFNMIKKKETYYLSRLEDEPLRTCKSTNFIGKVMFLAAITRPRMDENQNFTFDGKIGCFPIVNHVVAQRNSVNRNAGTLEMKPVSSINKDVVRSFMIEKVLPAIRAKWPREDMHETVYIQQDNAPTHIDPSDHQFCEAAKQDGFDIQLICQPPNSPDLNVLDLGFFRAIQAIQYKQRPKSMVELVNAVVKAFEEYEPVMSNRIFLTLQSCMIEIMKARGSNHYRIPHLKKGMLERELRLPLNMKCDNVLVNEVFGRINA